MQFTAKEINFLLNGTLKGNPDVKVNQLAKIEEAQEGALSFLANLKYEAFLYTTNASVVIVNEDLVIDKPVKATLIKVKDAYSSFSILLEKYNSLKQDKKGIEQYSFIHPKAKIGKDVYIGAFAYISAGAIIGDNTKIYPQCFIGDDVKIGTDSVIQSGAKIYHDCVIGNKVNIHANTVIGSDGFGFAPQPDGSYVKVSQIGNVIIEDNVEIGANTCIDRATMGSTLIKEGVKLDNLIQIAHNAEIGKNTVIASQTGISGSAKIGESNIIGGQVGIVGHVTLAKGTQIQAKSGINKSIEEENKKFGGAPAQTYQNYMRSQVIIQRLPDMERKIDELQKLVNKLQENLSK
ncbi:UDP-3-O-(3-hydroxymyristoyl)glucosamine N-acyltransferase [Pedobacter psychrophilus]|uniref:UDP-3-O-acylglucosamine N-acyltransferase n=1 Tax=Pedobacter psychrophilus TaxID=1826909 RepID=A0A179DCZ6_9SPHI|nr:UDP-3-O-(3-hydroxymyristoyl)glucosamine N-acyltransferase [Pedobacter psychrophilus]OAQ38911.1 UDP-3-O-(3-hydroxymyristoyl)glucosamine N-acyltransferase [Pedobacter psychrophilus]